MTLAPGIYEQLLTKQLLPALAEAELRTLIDQVEDQELPDALARHVASALLRQLRAMSREEQVAFVNTLPLHPSELLEGSGQQLLAVAAASDPRDLSTKLRPQIPLGEPALLTNAAGDRSLQSELRAEISTADRVDLLCAFVKWHGLRLLEVPLTDLRNRGIRLRLLTMTAATGSCP